MRAVQEIKVSEIELQTVLNKIRQAVLRGDLAEPFAAREIYRAHGLRSVTPIIARAMLNWAVANEKLFAERIRTGGRPALFYRLTREKKGAKEPEQHFCPVHPSNRWFYRLRFNSNERWTPWQCAQCRQPPMGWVGEQEDENPPEQIAHGRTNYFGRAGEDPFAKPLRGQRQALDLAADGSPKFDYRRDGCRKRHIGDYVWIGGGMNERWQCVECLGGLDNLLRFDVYAKLGYHLVNAGEPEDVQHIQGAGSGVPVED